MKARVLEKFSELFDRWQGWIYLTLLLCLAGVAALNLLGAVTNFEKAFFSDPSWLHLGMFLFNLLAGVWMVRWTVNWWVEMPQLAGALTKRRRALMALMPLPVLIEQAGYELSETGTDISARDMWLFHHHFNPPKKFKWWQFRKRSLQHACNAEISRRGKKESDEYLRSATAQLQQLQNAHIQVSGGVVYAVPPSGSSGSSP